MKALKRTSERKNNRSEGQKIFDLSLSVLLCTNSHYNNTYGVFKLEQCHENLIYVLAKEDHKAKQSTHHSRSLARFNSSNYSNRRNTNVPILDTTKYHRRLKSAQSLRRKRSSTDPYTASMLNHSLTDEIELRTTQAYKNYKKFSHDQRSTVKAFFGRIFANYEFSHSEPTIEKNNQEKQKIISDIDTLKKRLSTNDLSIDNSKVEMIGIFQRLKKLMNDRSTDETHSFGFYLRQEFKAIKLFQRFIHAESKNSDNENINYDSVFSDMEHHESVNSSEEDYNINSNDELTYKEPEQAPTYMQRTHSKKKKIDPPKPKKPNRSRRSRNSFSCCTSVPIQMISSDDEESKEDYSPEPKRESKQKKLRKNTPSHTKTLFNTNTACPTKNVRFNSNHNVFSHAKKSNENIEIKHPDTLYLNQHT